MKKVFAILIIVIFAIAIIGPGMVSGNYTYTDATSSCMLNKTMNDTTKCTKHENKDKCTHHQEGKKDCSKKCEHHQEGKKDCPKQCPHHAKKDSTTTATK